MWFDSLRDSDLGFDVVDSVIVFFLDDDRFASQCDFDIYFLIGFGYGDSELGLGVSFLGQE